MALPTSNYPGATWGGNEQDVANDPGAEDDTIAEARDHNLIAAEILAIEDDLRAAFATESAASMTAALQTLRASITAQASHAAQHQHGGADEVASSAPGANLIPKAGAGSTLSTGWLPQATESAQGAAEIATQAETDAGADDARIVTPLKLESWHDSMHPVGEDYQSAASAARSTTTSTTFQPKTQLVTPSLTGTYRIGWSAVIDQSTTSNEVEARLYNVTDAAVVNGVEIFQPKATLMRNMCGGFAEVVFAGAAKTFEIQYRQQGGGTAGIAEARIEIWRVA
jgi:hypothetical protein